LSSGIGPGTGCGGTSLIENETSFSSIVLNLLQKVLLVVGAVFNRDGLGSRYAANRGYNPLPPAINLSQFRIWINLSAATLSWQTALFVNLKLTILEK
jgi:hypothetical protein